jgi:predicted phage tail component-like protein
MSFTFKGISSDGFLKVTGVGYSVLPPSELQVLELAGMSGAKFVEKTDGVKEISVSYVLQATSEVDLMAKMRSMAGWLDSKTPEQLIFSNESDKYYLAMVTGSTEIEQFAGNVGIGTLTFICFDPYAYSITENTLTLVNNATTTLDLTCTAPVYPVFTMTCIANSSLLKLKKNWETETDAVSPYLEVTGTFVIGDVLVFDTFTGKVTLNGALFMQGLSLESQFFTLTKGRNHMNYSIAFNGLVKYRERWK